jgi:hypothetical protein
MVGHTSSRLLGAAIVMCAVALGTPAQANLIVKSGIVGGNTGTDNVVFNPCGTSGGPALTVQGCLASSHTTLVDFTGKENLTISGGGQAVINAQDGAFDYFEIYFDAGTSFNKLIFNLDALANGTAHFEAIDGNGDLLDLGSFDLNGRGSNFFTMFSLDDEVALKFILSSTVPVQDIVDLAQVRIGTIPAGSIPEPSALFLFGVGLLGIGAITLRRQRVLRGWA